MAEANESIQNVTKRRLKLNKRSSERRNVRRSWWEKVVNDNLTIKVVKIEHKDEKTGAWSETSFRLFRTDGSPGWKYQPSRPSNEVSIDQFIVKCGLETKDFVSCDEAKKVFQFTTFVLEDFQLCDDGTYFWVTADMYVGGIDKTVTFTGGRGTRSSIAQRRFYNAFNEQYEGVLIEDDDDEMEEAADEAKAAESE